MNGYHITEKFRNGVDWLPYLELGEKKRNFKLTEFFGKRETIK